MVFTTKCPTSFSLSLRRQTKSLSDIHNLAVAVFEIVVAQAAIKS
jgi:hypothetical protein